MMSETSIQLRSQASLGNTSIDSNGNPIIPFGLTQARKHALNKPRFIEFACNYVEVTHHDPIPSHLLMFPIDAGLPLRRFGNQRCDTQGILGQQEESRNCARMLVSSRQTDPYWPGQQMSKSSFLADVSKPSISTTSCRGLVRRIANGWHPLDGLLSNKAACQFLIRLNDASC